MLERDHQFRREAESVLYRISVGYFSCLAPRKSGETHVIHDDTKATTMAERWRNKLRRYYIDYSNRHGQSVEQMSKTENAQEYFAGLWRLFRTAKQDASKVESMNVLTFADGSKLDMANFHASDSVWLKSQKRK